MAAGRRRYGGDGGLTEERRDGRLAIDRGGQHHRGNGAIGIDERRDEVAATLERHPFDPSPS
ncbi:MAG: hypothetical protein U0132_09970 [Gemmatimonadaceae bacterium]